MLVQGILLGVLIACIAACINLWISPTTQIAASVVVGLYVWVAMTLLGLCQSRTVAAVVVASLFGLFLPHLLLSPSTLCSDILSSRRSVLATILYGILLKALARCLQPSRPTT